MRKLLSLVVLFVSAVLFAQPARAENDVARASSVELIDGGWFGEKRLAAVVMRLAPGWKTYWRVPGEGGLPPRFDFSGSRNVRTVRVLWPAPKRYSSPVTGETIGYKDEVAFPLLIAPEDASRPVILNMKLDYGICGEMCVPAQAQATLTLPPEASSTQARAYIERWLARTPLKDDARVRVAAARLMKENDGLVLEVTVPGPDAGRVSDILVEGVELAIFGRPRKIGGRGDAVVFRLPVLGLAEEKDFRKATLRLTILRGEKAVVRTAALP